MLEVTSNYQRLQNAVNAVFIRPPIFNQIFSCLSPASLIRVGRTSRILRDAVSDFSSRAFNINRHLSHFFSDPIAFRSLQAQTATLVSGSNALQFLDRTFYPEADLDIYMAYWNAEEVGNWLIENEGFDFTPNSIQPPNFQQATANLAHTGHMEHAGLLHEDTVQLEEYGMRGVHSVFTFVKGSGDHEKKVQVVATVLNPLDCILGFHSSCVMNFIAFDAAYSLYPRATFEERCSIIMSARSNHNLDEVLGKYALRGWSFFGHVWPHEEYLSKALFFVSVSRWVRDRHSWVVPLDVSDIKLRPRLSPTSIEFSWDPVVYNSWRLIKPAREPLEPHMEFSKISSRIFRYGYLVADRDLHAMLLKFVMSQGRVEFKKIRTLSAEDQAKCWTWWDSVIPTFCEPFKTIEAQNRFTRVAWA